MDFIAMKDKLNTAEAKSHCTPTPNQNRPEDVAGYECARWEESDTHFALRSADTDLSRFLR